MPISLIASKIDAMVAGEVGGDRAPECRQMVVVRHVVDLGGLMRTRRRDLRHQHHIQAVAAQQLDYGQDRCAVAGGVAAERQAVDAEPAVLVERDADDIDLPRGIALTDAVDGPSATPVLSNVTGSRTPPD